MKREATKLRLNKMLNDDKEEINEATRAAALSDFTHIAKEYFDTENVTLNIKKGKNGSDVTVSFRASRVKNFTTLK